VNNRFRLELAKDTVDKFVVPQITFPKRNILSKMITYWTRSCIDRGNRDDAQ
jgi:hypothetical protein